MTRKTADRLQLMSSIYFSPAARPRDAEGFSNTRFDASAASSPSTSRQHSGVPYSYIPDAKSATGGGSPAIRGVDITLILTTSFLLTAISVHQRSASSPQMFVVAALLPSTPSTCSGPRERRQLRGEQLFLNLRSCALTGYREAAGAKRRNDRSNTTEWYEARRHHRYGLPPLWCWK